MTSVMYLMLLKHCVMSWGTCLSALDFSFRKAKASLSLSKKVGANLDPVSDFFLVLFPLKIKAI